MVQPFEPFNTFIHSQTNAICNTQANNTEQKSLNFQAEHIFLESYLPTYPKDPISLRHTIHATDPQHVLLLTLNVRDLSIHSFIHNIISLHSHISHQAPASQPAMYHY